MKPKSLISQIDYRDDYTASVDIRRLASVILAQAVSDYLGGEEFYRNQKSARSQKTRNQNDAIEWFADESSTNVFSFVSICFILNFSPEWIRNRLISGNAKVARKTKNIVGA